MLPTKHINGEIELLRLLMAAVIVLHHSGAMLGYNISPAFHGYMAVEFFFIVSGYLMMKGIAKASAHASATSIEAETYHFLARKVTAIFPEIFIAFCLSLALCAACLPLPPAELLRWGYHGFINDCLLLRSTGIATWEGFNGVTWYISSMLLSMALLYPLFRRFKCAPFLAALSLLLLGALYHSEVVFHSPHTWISIGYKANFRALGDISLGAFAYAAAQHLSSVPWTRAARFLFMGSKLCIGFFLFSYMLLPHELHADGTMTIFFWLYIVIIFSNISPDAPYFCNTFCRLAGRLALPLYLSHVFITRCGKYIFPAEWSRSEKLLVYGILVCVSTCVVTILAALVRQNSGSIRALFICPAKPR